MRLIMTYNDKYLTVCGLLISSDPILFELEMLKVSDIYKYQVSKLIFKYINKMAPVNFYNWFKINHERHGYSTRSNININAGIKLNNLFIPSARTTNYGRK